MKTTIIYHRNDFDGLFCREIGKKFNPEAELIGWHFGDKPISPAQIGDKLIVMDLPLDRPFGFKMEDLISEPSSKGVRIGNCTDIVWIDHHKSAIESHPNDIPGYRIDGVAACRLAWQWFAFDEPHTPYYMPFKQSFEDRIVKEPLAVRLAGEYDVFSSHMKTDKDIELFQIGLKGAEMIPWDNLLSYTDTAHPSAVARIVSYGIPLKRARDEEYKTVITEQGFDVQFDGLTFLACNSHECDIRSQLFEAGIKPHHQALMGFTFNGRDWSFSLYQIEDKKDVDILRTAKWFKGGGHPGACGFGATNDVGWQVVNGGYRTRHQ